MADLTAVLEECRAVLAAALTEFNETLLTQAVRDALRELNGVTGVLRVSTLSTTGGYELDVTALTQPATIERVWFPFGDTQDAPLWIEFEMLTATLLRAREVELSAGSVARIFYRSPHTLAGLNEATSTTLTDEQIGEVVAGATAAACLAKTRELAPQITANKGVTRTLQEIAKQKRGEFERALAVYERQARRVTARTLRRTGRR